MNIFYRILAVVLPTKSVDQAIKVITHFAVKLAEAEANQRTIAENFSEEIVSITNLRDAAIAEADRAARVAKKLVDLTR